MLRLYWISLMLLAGGVSFARASAAVRSVGAVRGLMLRDGSPIPGCGIRIVKNSAFLRRSTRKYEAGDFFETATGLNGEFEIENVPEDTYRLLFAPAGETYWMRRRSEQPDFSVKTGMLTQLPALDMEHPQWSVAPSYLALVPKSVAPTEARPGSPGPSAAPGVDRAPAGLAIGIVDFEALVKQCHRAHDREQELQPINLCYVEEQKKWQQAIEWFKAGRSATEIEAALKLSDSNPGQQARSEADARSALSAAVRRYQDWRRQMERDLRIAMYQELQSVLPAAAAAQNVNLILKYRRPNLRAGEADVVEYEIDASEILFYARTIDLTDTIIRLMDQRYDHEVKLSRR